MGTEDIRRLVVAVGFIFRGSVHHHWTGEVPAISPEVGEIMATRIEFVTRSNPVLRGLAEQNALVITRRAGALRPCHHPILFTQVVSLGQQVLLREIGHVETSEETMRQVADAINAAGERPFRERVAGADLIMTSDVVESRALETARKPKGGHDPIWWLARVAVKAAHKGRKRRGARCCSRRGAAHDPLSREMHGLLRRSIRPTRRNWLRSFTCITKGYS